VFNVPLEPALLAVAVTNPILGMSEDSPSKSVFGNNFPINPIVRGILVMRGRLESVAYWDWLNSCSTLEADDISATSLPRLEAVKLEASIPVEIEDISATLLPKPEAVKLKASIPVDKLVEDNSDSSMTTLSLVMEYSVKQWWWLILLLVPRVLPGFLGPSSQATPSA
jgi:hypothetical protein